MLPFLDHEEIELLAPEYDLHDDESNVRAYKAYPFLEQPFLETDRLIFIPLTLDHAKQLYPITSDPELAKYTTMFKQHKSLKDTEQFIQRALQEYNNHISISWILQEKDGNTVIGIVKLYTVALHRRCEPGRAFTPTVWNKGYGTEVLKKLITFAFTTLKYHRFYATCDPLNIGSNKSLLKAGLLFEGCLRNYIIILDQSCDRNMYAITN